MLTGEPKGRGVNVSRVVVTGESRELVLDNFVIEL
jgi:hypothetical protein